MIGSALSVVLAYFAMPNPFFHVPLLAFFCFVPFFRYLINAPERAGRKVFLFVLVLVSLLLLPFDKETLSNFPVILLGLSPVLMVIAAVHSLPFVFLPKVPERPLFVLVPFYWTLSQFILSNIPFGIPLPLEASLSNVPFLLLPSSLLGPYYATFLIILINFSLSCSLSSSLPGPSRAFSPFFPLFALFPLLLLPLLITSIPSIPSSPFCVGIIQPNLSIPDFNKKRSRPFFEAYYNKRLFLLTENIRSSKPDLVVWPEAAGTGIYKSGLLPPGLNILSGTEMIENGKKINVSFCRDPLGNFSELYKKIKLFPIFESFFMWPGSKYVLFDTHSDLGRIAGMLCIDSFYPSVSREFVKRGASALFFLASDASFGNSSIPYIHAALAVIRGIENRRYSVFVNNTGPSQVADDKGNILFRMPYGQAGYGVCMFCL